MVRLEIPVGSPSMSEVITKLARSDGYITIQNADPGLQALRVKINGRSSRVTEMKPLGFRLRDQKIWTMDVTDVVEGDNNILELTAYGQAGASAFIFIGDSFAEFDNNDEGQVRRFPKRSERSSSRRSIVLEW